MAAAALPATTSLTAFDRHVAVAALPAIERDLHLSAADAPGVITACTIPLAGLSTAVARGCVLTFVSGLLAAFRIAGLMIRCQ